MFLLLTVEDMADELVGNLDALNTSAEAEAHP